jgi:hypothetical protein
MAEKEQRMKLVAVRVRQEEEQSIFILEFASDTRTARLERPIRHGRTFEKTADRVHAIARDIMWTPIKEWDT